MFAQPSVVAQRPPASQQSLRVVVVGGGIAAAWPDPLSSVRLCVRALSALLNGLEELDHEEPQAHARADRSQAARGRPVARRGCRAAGGDERLGGGGGDVSPVARA